MTECAIGLPESVNLPVPYLSQLDNVENPYGSCNVTSVSMTLKYFGRVGTGDGQFEDQLYRQMEALGWSRHDPYHLARLIREHGLKDEFTNKADWIKAREWLAQGNPLIVHGYFTDFGHIIVIRGYDPTGWFVNDPYGEYWDNGYDNSVSGENLHYSTALMERTCSADGDLWLHFVSK